MFSGKLLLNIASRASPGVTWAARGCGTAPMHRDRLKAQYDAVIVGAGHNGLIAAAYLARAGLDVCVVERRHLVGGAAVTEEIVPGFKFSRASYVLSLLRPHIVRDLELARHGLKVYMRDPNSYTPLLEPGGIGGKTRSLLLSRDGEHTKQQIAQFSTRDSQMYHEYEAMLERIVAAIDPLLDNPPVSLSKLLSPSLGDKWASVAPLRALLSAVRALGKDFPDFYKFMTSPAQKILDTWFESEPLKATLATDSVIGAMLTPGTPGSGYVLLHHVMGELEGVKGAWGYVEGGMGGVSQAIARSAASQGASIFCNAGVGEVIVRGDRTEGVVLDDGTEIRSKLVLSNATPTVTFLKLLPQDSLPEELVREVQQLDTVSPVTKINVAVNQLPNFLADPNTGTGTVMPHHRCTIHLNCEHSSLITDAYLDCQAGRLPNRPVIEMVIPSSLDPTLAPAGSHVALLFTQYTPYTLANGRPWDDHVRKQYADIVFDSIEQYAPGFRDSVVGHEVLSPPDLENIFGLTGGNIFHGSMSLDQLYMTRPVSALSNYRGPVRGLYLCGSGGHPGGGVMGSPGYLASQAALSELSTL